MDGDILRVFDNSNTLFFEVKRTRNRLYKTLLRTRRNMCLLSSQDDSGWLWHQRRPYANYYTKKVNGYLEHNKILGSHLKKLDDLSEEEFYVEVEKCEKGHQFFDARKRKPRIRREGFFGKRKRWTWTEKAAASFLQRSSKNRGIDFRKVMQKMEDVSLKKTSYAKRISGEFSVRDCIPTTCSKDA
ncbi:hypothetical protein L2E82_13420 [Cichorium intybus]|uniref:Uncharacterized protein n=1 Tax=Cichorium intybus TaxID=13427 RepID=A0ACB9EYL6_CICIN|nr:hypothetical protein L2E82_13420 [Cichorium intybus]